MSLGPWQIALIVLLLLVLFGRGRISDMMGDFGKGISSFKKGLNEGEEDSKKSSEAKPRIVDQGGPHDTPQADVKAKSQDDSAS